MFFAMTFVCMRIAQILTLIPTMGMLAYFVNVFVSHNALTPDPILILFITAVLALAWSVLTLFSYHRSAANARFVALVDLAVFGTLIAAVYLLRRIADADCAANPPSASRWTGLLNVPPGTGPESAGAWRADSPCAMLKACWALAIINIILFFVTAVSAFTHGDQLSASYYYRDETRYRSRSRSHHRRRHDHHGHSSRPLSSRHHHHHHRRSHSRHRSPSDYVRRVYV